MIRVALCGDSNTGKTSIINKFVLKDAEVESTIGCSFVEAEIVNSQNQKINLHITDTAGQEKYKALMPIYFKDINVFIIVFDLTKIETFNHVIYWKDEIRNHGPADSVIILVGNKNDLENCVISNQAGEEKANEIGANIYYETSAITGDGVYQVFNYIVEEKGIPCNEDVSRCSEGTVQLDNPEKKKHPCC